MTHPKTKLSRAIGLLPAIEGSKNRTFTLFDNNLYFTGDTSWFKISNFIECNCNVTLSYESLNTAVGLEGTIRGELIDEYSMRFTNDKFEIQVGVRKAEKEPEVNIRPDEDFVDLTGVLPLGRGIFSVADKASFVSAATIGEYKCIVCTSNSVTAGIAEKGSFSEDIDLTRIEPVILSAITNRAKAVLGKRMAEFMIREEDYSVHSCCSSTAANVSDKARNLIESIVSGQWEENVKDDIVTIDIPASELIKVVDIATKVNDSGVISYFATPDGVKVLSDNMIGNAFKGNVKAEVSESIRFESLLITKPLLEFLGTVAMDTKDMVLRLMVYMAGSMSDYMVIKALNTVDKYRAFAVMGVRAAPWTSIDME